MNASKSVNALCIARSKTDPTLYRTSNGWADASLSLPTFSPTLLINATNKLRTKVAGSDFHAGVFLGEGKESLRMITQSATKVYNTLRLIKRGRFGEARRFLTGHGNNRRVRLYDDPGWIDSVPFQKRDRYLRQYDRDISSAWLELSYGWLPLLADTKSAAEFLAHQMSVPLQERIVVRNGQTTSMQITSSSPTDFYFTKGEARVSVQVIAYLRESSVVGLSGLTDAASVAWELMPWSFVIDWFIPVGNYLSARGAAQSLKGDFVVSKFIKVKASGLALRPSNGSNFASQWTLESGHEARSDERVSLTREVTNTLAIPLPSMNPLGNVPSWTRAANAVALLDQLRPRAL